MLPFLLPAVCRELQVQQAGAAGLAAERARAGADRHHTVQELGQQRASSGHQRHNSDAGEPMRTLFLGCLKTFQAFLSAVTVFASSGPAVVINGTILMQVSKWVLCS
jgi:hypothetical protein